MQSISPYLNFSGNTEEAFNFYKGVFGTAFSVLQRFSDTANAEKFPEADRDKIMHVSLPLGNGVVLMATDSLESMGQKLVQGNNFYICLNTDSKAEADKLFKGLSEGGKIEMNLEDTFWGAYFGCFKDKFGVQWMLNFTEQKG
jgi:PhnB protein